MGTAIPKVSVIIPVYNCEKYIGPAIDSVLAQTYKDFELIVVNDGSTDGTPQVLDRYEGQIVRIDQENKNVAEARNTGVRAARGKYLAFLDSDDLWHPEKLGKQVPLLDSDSSVGYVYTNVEFLFGDTRCLGEGFLMNPPHRGEVVNELLPNNFVCVSSVMMRAVLFDDEVELFRSKFILSEDYDVHLRMSVKCKFDYNEEKLVKYRIHPINASRNRALMLERAVGIVEDFILKHPEVGEKYPCLFKKALLDWKILLGYEYLCTGRLREARRCYFEYCTGTPLDVRRWVLFFLTFLGTLPFKVLGIYGKESFMSEEAVEKYMESKKNAHSVADR